MKKRNLSNNFAIRNLKTNSQNINYIQNLKTTREFKIKTGHYKTNSNFFKNNKFLNNIIDDDNLSVLQNNLNLNKNKKLNTERVFKKYNRIEDNIIKINVDKKLLTFENFENNKKQRIKIKNNIFNYIKRSKTLINNNHNIKILNDDNFVKNLNKKEKIIENKKLKKEKNKLKYIEEKNFIKKLDFICKKLYKQIIKIKKIKLNKFIISKYILTKMEKILNSEKFEILLHIFFYHNKKLKNNNDLSIGSISSFLFLRGKKFYIKIKNPKLYDDLKDYVYTKNNVYKGNIYILDLIKKKVLITNKLVLNAYYELSDLFSKLLFDFKKKFFVNLDNVNVKENYWKIISQTKEFNKRKINELSNLNLVVKEKDKIKKRESLKDDILLKFDNIPEYNNKIRNKIDIMNKQGLFWNHINEKMLNFNYTLRNILVKWKKIIYDKDTFNLK